MLVPLLAVGLVSFIIVRSQQGDGGALETAQHPQPLTPAAVDHVLRSAPLGRQRASSARCSSLGDGPLQNPWRCFLRYPSGQLIEYRVTLSTNGSYVGEGIAPVTPQGPGRITGCCVPVP